MNQSAGSRVVRIFISSTFRDFEEERDLLVRKVFPELRRKCRERQVDLIDVDLRWGITEEEAQQGRILPICLAEIDRSRPFFMGLIGERYGWVPSRDQFDRAILVEQPWLEQHRGGTSITELEILHGVLNNPDMKGRSFFYFRDPEWSARKGGVYLCDNHNEKTRLNELKIRIRASGFPVMENYPDPEALARRVSDDLWKLIDVEYPEGDAPDSLGRERMRHEAYSAFRRRFYLGGERYFKILDEAMSGGQFTPVLVTGLSGAGKSALLANWVAGWSRRNPSAAVIMHHLGCGSESANPERLVLRLIMEIARLTGEECNPDPDPDRLFAQLPVWLASASAWAKRNERRVLILLDGLDKLSDEKNIRWLPDHFPPCVLIVASCLNGKIATVIATRNKWLELHIDPLGTAEQARFVRDYLARYRKVLPEPLLKTIQSDPRSKNPLFLLTMLEELRIFGSHEDLQIRLGELLSQPASKLSGQPLTVDDIFEHVISRIESDAGTVPVRRALSAIWASRGGLFTDELLNYAELAPSSWATIHNALNESVHEDGGLIKFSHDYLNKAVQDRYGLSGEVRTSLHKHLAGWFENRELTERNAIELIWQWEQASSPSDLVRNLLRMDVFRVLHSKHRFELIQRWSRSGEKDVTGKYKLAWESWHRNTPDPAEAAELAVALGEFLEIIEHSASANYREHLISEALEIQRTRASSLSPDLIEQVERRFAVILIKSRDKEKQRRGAELLCRIMGEREARLGLGHPLTAQMYLDVGVYYDQCRMVLKSENVMGEFDMVKEAKERNHYLRQALKSLIEYHGEWHLDVADALNKLAAFLPYERGLMAVSAPPSTEECDHLVKALEIRRRILGDTHPVTLQSCHNVAGIYGRRGRLHDAASLIAKASANYEQVFGVEHPTLAQYIRQYALVMMHLQKNAEAIELFKRCMKLDSQRVAESAEPDYHYIQDGRCLASLYLSGKMYDEQERLFDELSFYYKKHNITRIENIVWYSFFSEITNKLLMGRVERYSARTEDLAKKANALHELGVRYREESNRKAEQLLIEAIEIRRSLTGMPPDNLAASLSALGECYNLNKQFSKAVPLLEEALRLRRSIEPADQDAISLVAERLQTAKSNCNSSS